MKIAHALRMAISLIGCISALAADDNAVSKGSLRGLQFQIQINDRDNDGVPDAVDNCPDTFNPPLVFQGRTFPQLDRDGDGGKIKTRVTNN